jgi:hypothetical protein
MPAIRIDTPTGSAIAMTSLMGKPVELQHQLSVVTRNIPSLIKEKLVGFQSIEHRQDSGDNDEHVILTNIEAFAEDETGVPFNWDFHYDPSMWFLGIKRPNGIIILFNSRGLIGINQYNDQVTSKVEKRGSNVSTLFPRGVDFIVDDE